MPPMPGGARRVPDGRRPAGGAWCPVTWRAAARTASSWPSWGQYDRPPRGRAAGQPARVPGRRPPEGPVSAAGLGVGVAGCPSCLVEAGDAGRERRVAGPDGRAGGLVLARDGGPGGPRARQAARRSIIETATRNAAGGTAATTRSQSIRLGLGQVGGQAEADAAEPAPRWAMTAAGRRLASCLSRWRSRAAMTQVRSMQTATAQDMGPCWPCWAAVSRMWVNDPAPAMTASTVMGRASATASRRRPALTGHPAGRLVRDGPALRGHRCAGAGLPPSTLSFSRLVAS